MTKQLQNSKTLIENPIIDMGFIVAIIWKNGPKWSIESISKNFDTLFFYNSNDFLNNSIAYADIIHKDDLARVTQEVSMACAQNKKSFQHKPYRIKDGNGEYRWVKDITTLCYDNENNITHFIGYITEITTETENLLEIKRNLSKLNEAEKIAHLGTWEYNNVTKKLFWSDQIFSILQIDKTIQPSYKLLLSLICEEDRNVLILAEKNAIKTKTDYLIKYKIEFANEQCKYILHKGSMHFDKNGKIVKSNGIIQDISQLIETELKLKQALAALKSYKLGLDESSIVTLADLKGNITYANSKFYEVSGFSEQEVLGKPHSIIRHPQNPKSLFKELWSTIKAKKIWKKIIKNMTKHGDTYWVDLVIIPILNDAGDITEYIAIRHDITKMMEYQEKLTKILCTDNLTNLGSRYKLIQDIKNAHKGSLALIDIKNFSHINDFYGSQTGDRILKFVAKEISLFTQNYTNVIQAYRLNGDEYALFGPLNSREKFYDRMVEFLEQISQLPITIEENQLHLDFYIGISHQSKQRLLTTADMALKFAKSSSQNIAVYSKNSSLEMEYHNNIEWTKNIKNAIESENVVAVFQPIIDNSTQQLEKYEALIRLRIDGKLITPYYFLEIAKKTKYYKELTKIMILKSFKTCCKADVTISINLTVDDILDENIKNFVIDQLEHYSIGAKIIFEIVESESIENFDKVLSFIEDVKSYGCKIAIDDFGTGYSNFVYLMRLKADFIKIDGSLIKDIYSNNNSFIVVKLITEFAKKMGIETIAEFVENKDIYDKVTGLGIDSSQGYYFSKPIENITSPAL